MAGRFQAHFLSAERTFYEGPMESVVVPTNDGYYGILAHHSDVILAVVPGMLSYRLPGEETQYVFVSHGMVKVESNEVLILVNVAERPEEIDENRALREAEEAREAILQKKSIMEYRSAQAQLARAAGRLRTKHYVTRS